MGTESYRFSEDAWVMEQLKRRGVTYELALVDLEKVNEKLNFFQTRPDTDGIDYEHASRISKSIQGGEKLPMPCFAIDSANAYSPDREYAIVCGKHRTYTARNLRLGHVDAIVAIVRSDEDKVALRDVSMFSNASHGKQVPEDDIYAYCANRAFDVYGHESIPSVAEVKALLPQWGPMITPETVIRHCRVMKAKASCRALGYKPPAGCVQVFTTLYDMKSSPEYKELAAVACRHGSESRISSLFKRKRRPADILNEANKVLLGYKKGASQKSVREKLRAQCSKLVAMLKDLEKSDYTSISDVAEANEAIDEFLDTASTILSRLRTKTGGVAA